jgi:O-antigen/teichoic acid export membrane protein
MFTRVFSTKINALANFAGSIWIALLGLIFVPIYLRYIGIEGYGLIGIFNSILAFILLLDFGLSPTLNRELARLSVREENAQEMRDTKSTLEVFNWSSALFICLFFLLLAPLIAKYWIQPKELSVEIVTQAILIMGINVAIQFTINFYIGGLMGLQKQVLINVINLISGTVRFVGAFLVLAFFSATIQAFLLWQSVAALLQVILLAMTLKRSLPATGEKGRFRKDILQRLWGFAAGVTGITVVSLVLTQTDKIILSKMLSLEEFGYYMLAVTMSAMSINVITSSVSHAVYPQFSKLVSTGDEDTLRGFYHHCSQIVSVILFPIISILSLYSYDVLLLWTRNETIAANTHLLLSVVVVGTGLNGLMWLPYFIQLAHGWTKLAFYINVGAIVILIPLMIFGIFRFGAIGGAVGWVTLNSLYILITVQIMHRRILKGEQWKWYFTDVLIPFLCSFLVAGAGKFFFTSGQGGLKAFLILAIISLATFTAAVFSTRATRNYLFAGGRMFRPVT